MVAGREPTFGCDGAAPASDLDPAGGHAHLVVAEPVDVSALATPRELPVALFEDGRDNGLERPFEGDGYLLVWLAAEPDSPERLEDLLVQRAHHLAGHPRPQ